VYKTVGGDYLSFKDGRRYGNADWSEVAEDVVANFTKKYRMHSSVTWEDEIDFTKPPTFGVRRLREDECKGPNRPYAAFRDGVRIRGTVCHKPEHCIEQVIDMLTPAVPAVTLDDLEVVEEAGT
jgi:hypothetical protein